MIEIPLSKGKFAIIDDQDLPLVEGLKWHVTNGIHHWYAAANKKGQDGKWKKVSMHRVISGVEKGTLVDHINRNGLDNRRENLRICTISQNTANSVIPRNNTSGFKGVCFERNKQKWRPVVQCQGKKYFMGYFQKIEDAVNARNELFVKLFGEFARLQNIPENHLG